MASVFDRIFADVRKDIPSVVDAVVRQELFRVMDDFTQATNIWQQECTLDITPNKVNYDLYDQITNGKANRLLLVYDPNGSTKQWAQPGITMRVPGLVVLYRPTGVTATWKAVVAKHTSDPVDGSGYPPVDEWIVQKYADTIGRGVIARLQLEPQKPYSNPMLAAVNQKAYIDGRALARANDGHANVIDAQAWRFPQTWATVSKKAWS